MIDYISGLVRCNYTKEFKLLCKKWSLVLYCHGGDLFEIVIYKTGVDESLLDELREVWYDINTEYTDENGDKFKFTLEPQQVEILSNTINLNKGVLGKWWQKKELY